MRVFDHIDHPGHGALLRELSGDTVIGPILIGSEKPVQIAPMTSIAPEILTLAVLASAGIVG